MYYTLDVSYWLTLGLALLAAGFLVRVFIIQHDCGHGSFFRSRHANAWVGRMCSIVTLTPYANWRHEHNGHHAKWNCLDRRGTTTDLYSKCLTVEEYLALSRGRRLLYRLSRSQFVMFLLIPPLIFLVLYRFPIGTPKERGDLRRSVHGTNLALAGCVVALGLATSWLSVAMVHLPIMLFASIAGTWLFFVQHQFDRTTWVDNRTWSPAHAVLTATSHLKLPAVLQWFSGNIGLHHIHHMDTRVPNYQLEACHRRFAKLHDSAQIGFWQGLNATRLALWDDTRKIMVRFADLRRMPAAP
ncbi:MAG: fatty acid desaturase [Alphaproteobacteria bacterium]